MQFGMMVFGVVAADDDSPPGPPPNIPPMPATLTVQLDAEVLQFAEQEARAHQMTLPEIVQRQLSVMAQNWRASQVGQTPVTDELRGSFRLPPETNYRELIVEKLRKKYGEG